MAADEEERDSKGFGRVVLARMTTHGFTRIVFRCDRCGREAPMDQVFMVAPKPDGLEGAVLDTGYFVGTFFATIEVVESGALEPVLDRCAGMFACKSEKEGVYSFVAASMDFRMLTPPCDVPAYMWRFDEEDTEPKAIPIKEFMHGGH